MGRQPKKDSPRTGEVERLRRELQEVRTVAQDLATSRDEVMRSRDALYLENQELRHALVHVEQALTLVLVDPGRTEAVNMAFAPKGVAGTCEDLRRLTGQSSERQVRDVLQMAKVGGLPN